MYQAIYKCRLCGELFSGETGDIKDLSITNILAQHEPVQHIRKPFRCDLHEPHNCQDGSIGFGDFQGFKKLEGEKRNKRVVESRCCEQGRKEIAKKKLSEIIQIADRLSFLDEKNAVSVLNEAIEKFGDITYEELMKEKFLNYEIERAEMDCENNHA